MSLYHLSECLFTLESFVKIRFYVKCADYYMFLAYKFCTRKPQRIYHIFEDFQMLCWGRIHNYPGPQFRQTWSRYNLFPNRWFGKYIRLSQFYRMSYGNFLMYFFNSQHIRIGIYGSNAFIELIEFQWIVHTFYNQDNSILERQYTNYLK